jgi:NADP-dependent 3-hydroxy acid dehydrogenase YdfG
MARTAVVTGATGGIGSAVVRALAAGGFRVFAVGRSADELDSLRGTAPGIVPVMMDLSRPVELAPPLSEVTSVDALVHCAGIADVASIAEAPEGLWRRTFAVNVVAAAELTACLLPAVRAVPGSVIFINRSAGMHAIPRLAAYVASKVALRELADSLRAEEHDHGVQVTTIYPGATDTALLRKARHDFGAPFDPDACLAPDTLAALVLTVLDGASDAHLHELSIDAPSPGG